jgi:non-specific serine/threonine protein kinase
MPKLTLETLSEERLIKSVDHEIFTQGQSLHLEGRVQVIDIKNDSAQCIVQDKHPYRVEIKVANKYLYLKCDCRYAFRGLICEHDIAACLAVRDRFRQKLPPTWRNQINKVIDASSLTQRKTSPSHYLLLFSLQELETANSNSWKITPFLLPHTALTKFNFNFSEPYTDQELQDWISSHPALPAHLKMPYQLLNLDGCLNCPPQSVILANYFLERARTFSPFTSNTPLDDYYSLIASSQSPLYLGVAGNPISKKLQTFTESCDLQLYLDHDNQGIHIQAHFLIPDRAIDVLISKNLSIRMLYPAALWILCDHYLFKLRDQNQIDLLQAFLDSEEVIIPPRDEGLFQKKYYLSLAEKFVLHGNLVEWQTLQTDALNRVYLSETEAGIQAELRFGYGDVEVPYESNLPEETIVQIPDSWALILVKRNPAEEQVAFESLASATYGLKRTPNASKDGQLSLRARVHPVDFLLHGLKRLADDGFEVYGEEQLTTARVNRNSPTISFQVSSGIDWFDVKAIINFGELEISLKDIRRALKKKEHYIKLPDGTIGAIPEEWSENYKHLFALGDETEAGLRMARHHIGLIDHVLAGAGNMETDPAYLDYRQRLLNFSGISTTPLPNNFVGELRPYQKAGYDWLHFLREYRFGGCLADDMGLGKTVQVLAFLQSLKEMLSAASDRATPDGEIDAPRLTPGTSLIVVPRSLLVNWQREAARFTPAIRIYEYFETNRSKDLTIFDQYDVVITTYGIVLRDLSALCKYTFNYVLLDESQAIKNPLSQTSRAVRLLQGRHRLVLTGTPVENSSIELWSQFAFLNPGLLGHLDYFKTEFILPIEKRGEEQVAQTLRRIVYPFILRRTKDQVAPELPPRTERILYCDMEPAQKKMYQRTRDYYRGLVLGMLEKEGLNNTRFRILEGLLRLRQISNHPRLVDDKFKGESGKFELLMETIETLRAEGHKALVFSQFVQMLRLLRHPMDERHIPYVYLDGHTRNRMELVDRYQNDPNIPFFLISLKAGGQGLNLTAADYVIHIDPWWNPAVEMQASDRTHRIGQEKPVFIFKLITRDSVEEKITLLQEQKKRLVDSLITSESGFFKSLTADDIQALFS